LRLPARDRRRIVGEAREHLADLVADAPPETLGGAQSWAIEAFGEPAVLARRFAEELAVGASRRATRVGAAALVLFLVLCDLCTSSFLNVRLGWVTDGPGTPLLWITGQVGLVAGVLSLVRARIARRTAGIDTVRLRYAARGYLVLAVSATISVGIAASGAVSELTAPAGNGAVVLLVTVLIAACAAVSLVCGHRALGAERRVAALDKGTPTATGREAIADLFATARDGATYLARQLRMPISRRVATADLGRVTMRLLRPFDPREHPWRYATLIALLAGGLVPVLDLVVLAARGQLNASQLGDLAISAPALIAFEASLVLLGYATLGAYLGLRPRRLRD
jgi:hypothetical protein